MSKICICAIGKLENRYIREWADWYINKLKVDKIFLYDNNDVDGERFEDEINDYIEYGMVELIDYRGNSSQIRQLDAYTDCYLKHKSEFDWFCFFDIDEFLVIDDNKTLNEFVGQEKFKNFDMIHTMWLNLGDSGIITDDGKGCVERFTQKCKGLPHSKMIIRGNLDGVYFNRLPHRDPHTIYTRNLRCCDARGQKKDQKRIQIENPILEGAHINHYVTKTIDEWLNYKVKRGHPSMNKVKTEMFFGYNEKTKEKEEFIEKWLKENQN